MTAATLTRWTSPGYLLRRLWRALRIALLRWQIWETEQWLLDCRRDGLVHSLSLTDIRAQLSEMRVRLALLEQS